MFKKVTEKDIKTFIAICDEKSVFTEKAIREEYTHDEMIEYGAYAPEVVIECNTTEEISKVLKHCNEEMIPVTPRGSGTGLCGGAVALHGGVLLSTKKMNRILEIDKNTLTGVVEPGVLLLEFASAVNDMGLLYAPDPGEKSASLGGNVMTNAGGMRAVKYGVTRDYVKGMEVVIANGNIIEVGGKIAKNSSGYSLKDLLIGSEGTLVVVSKIYLKLLPKPNKMISLLIPFHDFKTCMDMVPVIMNLPNIPTTLEFMEQAVLEDSREYLGKTFPNNEYPAYLIVSYSGNNKKEIEDDYADCARICLEQGAVDVFISDTEERQEAVWSARGAFLEAIKSSTPEMDECDVVVDIDKVYDFLQFVNELSTQYQIRIRSFGHAGDGNLHIYVCKDDYSDDKWKVIVKACMDAMYAKAKEMKGQVSGEHGIGHAKKEYLWQSLDETQMELMKGIKQVFDPKGILNPGKIL